MSGAGGPRWAEFQLRADLGEVARVTAEMRALLPDRLAEDERNAVEIAMAEALTNVVKHGYDGGEGSMRVLWREGSRDLKIEIADEGNPIDEHRLTAAGPDTFAYDATDLGALPESGMGLALIKMAFDEVQYHSADGTNRLRLVKYLG